MNASPQTVSPLLRIAIAGGTGFIGTALTERLREAGHTVLHIGRRRSGSAAPDIVWDPKRGTLDSSSLGTADAVINLAGETIGKRWTEGRKREIRSSRVQGTALLASAIASLPRRPRVFVSASAVGIYGDRGDAILDESHPIGTGFLAEVGEAWERSADPARDAGVRVVHPRFGLVLGKGGGLLPQLTLVFQLGAGGKLGGGAQWMSWISRTDVARAVERLVLDDRFAGPVNVVAPAPVTNAEFARAMGRVLHRPALIPVPALAIRFLLGEMGEQLVLQGQRVIPKRLLDAGFAFTHPTLDAALRAELQAR